MRRIKPAAVRLATSVFAAIAAVMVFGAGDVRAEEKLGIPAPSAMSGPVQSARQPAQFLPLPTGTGRPIRQFVFCDTTGLPGGLCRYTFFQVPANKLLQIESVSCFAATVAAAPRHFIMTNSGNVPDLENSAKAVIVPRQIVDAGSGNFVVFADSNGPFFFQGGERAFLIGGGDTSSGCGLSGLLFQAN